MLYEVITKTARKIEEALLSEGDDLGAQGFRPIQEAYVRAVPDVEITARSYQKALEAILASLNGVAPESACRVLPLFHQNLLRNNFV